MKNSNPQPDSGNFPDRLMREKEVEAATGLGRTVIKGKIKAGRFPAPINQRSALGIPGRTNYWLASEIKAYIDNEVAVHRANTQKTANEGLNGWLTRALGESMRRKGARGQSGLGANPFTPDSGNDNSGTSTPRKGG